MVSRKEVAERAGVSTAVVSYVLNNRSIVKEETRQRVMEAIRELGYVPNQTARSLKTKKTGQLAVLVGFLGNPFEAGILLHLEEEASRAGNVVTYHTYSPGREDELRRLLTGRVDGVVLLGQSLRPETWAYFQTIGLPAVSIMEPSAAAPGLPFVDLDWTAEYRRLIAHLKREGHERIAFLAGGTHTPYGTRWKHFRNALQVEGLSYGEEDLLHGDGRFEGAKRTMLETFGGSSKFTAVVCANDLMAAGCLSACREAGLAVPRQLAVAGCENILMSSETNPGLTVIHYPRRAAAEAGFRLLQANMTSPSSISPELLKGELILRASTDSTVSG
ncbi:LacI family transcriptional regulator [Paenibacillus sp. CC-CFT747]|nr:LacI family transcriptional regulator [Paenibacillus sp. CC-CFT747]